MFRDFCGFLVATGLLASQVTHLTLLAFMEFLLQNAFTPSNIANYMAGLRASFVLYDLNTVPFQHQRLQYFHKAAKLQTLNFPKPKLHLDENLLLKIIIACDDLQFPVIFKPLYLLAFFPSSESLTSCHMLLLLLTLLANWLSAILYFLIMLPPLSSSGLKPCKINQKFTLSLFHFWEILLYVLSRPYSICYRSCQVIPMYHCFESPDLMDWYH